MKLEIICKYFYRMNMDKYSKSGWGERGGVVFRYFMLIQVWSGEVDIRRAPQDYNMALYMGNSKIMYITNLPRTFFLLVPCPGLRNTNPKIKLLLLKHSFFYIYLNHMICFNNLTFFIILYFCFLLQMRLIMKIFSLKYISLNCSSSYYFK